MQYPDENDFVFKHFYPNPIIPQADAVESRISSHLDQALDLTQRGSGFDFGYDLFDSLEQCLVSNASQISRKARFKGDLHA
jgi:hypothetical protein